MRRAARTDGFNDQILLRGFELDLSPGMVFVFDFLVRRGQLLRRVQPPANAATCETKEVFDLQAGAHAGENKLAEARLSVVGLQNI